MLNFCFNELSFEVSDQNKAFEKFFNAIRGMIYYVDKKQTRAAIHSSVALKQLKLTPSYSYNDFMLAIRDIDKDIFSALLDADVYSPYEDYYNENDSIYHFNNCYHTELGGANYDIFPYAYTRSAVLISMNTHVVWNDSTILFCDFHTDATTDQDNSFEIRNISEYQHGFELIQNEIDAEQQLPEDNLLVYSHAFQDWYNMLSDEQKKRTRNRIRMCIARNFRVDKTLIKFLADYHLWEVRYDNIDGGAIRLMIFMHSNKWHFATGFIKHGQIDYRPEVSKAKHTLENEFNITI